MNLTEAQQKFIVHWGEMGTRWGINRTVAQVHALLYISPKPLHAEEIQQTLGVARSNVSNCIKELQGWGIVRVVHVLGDRRDYFETLKDVWELFRIILDVRKQRELDPTITILEECIADAQKGPQADRYTAERLEALHEFIYSSSTWYGQMCKLPNVALRKFLRMGSRVEKWLGKSKG